MRIIRIWNPISCILYRLEVTLFMNRHFSIICMGKNQVLKYFCPLSVYVAVKVRFQPKRVLASQNAFGLESQSKRVLTCIYIHRVIYS